MVQARKGVLTTGDSEIDKKMGGGLPLGSLTLIEGDNDAGKSSLAQQMIWGSLGSGHRIGVFTTENTPKSYLRHMDSLGLDVTDFYLLGWLRIYALRLSSERLETVNDLNKEQASILEYIGTLTEEGQEVVRGLRNLLEIVERERSEVIFIDALTGFLTGAAVDEIIYFFETMKRICDGGKTVVITLHAIHGHQPFLTTRIRAMSDCHLVLRATGDRGKIMKTLEISKVRGAERNTGAIWGFEILPELGIRIVPIRKVQV